jgi:hypothetical protein
MKVLEKYFRKFWISDILEMQNIFFTQLNSIECKNMVKILCLSEIFIVEYFKIYLTLIQEEEKNNS